MILPRQGTNHTQSQKFNIISTGILLIFIAHLYSSRLFLVKNCKNLVSSKFKDNKLAWNQSFTVSNTVLILTSNFIEKTKVLKLSLEELPDELVPNLNNTC
jgi:hypothetical protein